ncbi:hypothetical protein QBC41DRAFT_58834 [Cercophora samala]|uniref:Cell cycle control protein n=1 Tax=Cercophora samala TaxID=330535 RepID=A0AA39ZHU2_9PEZI|nr:hypothetical protein QBC41DRAFT_58834 [Cercophora samala]
MDRNSPDLGFYSSDNHESDSDPDADLDLDYHNDGVQVLSEYDHNHDHDHDPEQEAEFHHRLHHLHHLHQLRHVLGIDLAAVHADHDEEYMNDIFGDSDDYYDLDDDLYLEGVEGLEDLEEDEIRESSEALSEDSLFVDQRPRRSSPNRLPPIAQLVPEVGSRRAVAIGGRGLPPHQQANRESSFGFGSLGSDDLEFLDELVEMEVARPARRHRTMAAAGSMTPAANAVVIDLTGDDEEMEQPRANPNPNPNPRRQTLNHRTPSLTRSDGSLLGNPAAADIIDLTMDEPAPPLRRQHPARAQPRFNLAQPAPVLVLEDDDDGIFRARTRLQGGGHFSEVLHQLQHSFRPVAGFFEHVTIFGRGSANNPLGRNAPILNYGHHRGGQEHAAPKPAHVPPKPAREGFTRATGEASEDVAVCPGCEEELKYDPDESRADMPPQKRARTKKDNEEHHFWAVKECGHVYCKSCYEGRGRAKGKTAHFRPGPGKSKALCNVPECESEVSSKAAWVGLFL